MQQIHKQGYAEVAQVGFVEVRVLSVETNSDGKTKLVLVPTAPRFNPTSSQQPFDVDLAAFLVE